MFSDLAELPSWLAHHYFTDHIVPTSARFVPTLAAVPAFVILLEYTLEKMKSFIKYYPSLQGLECLACLQLQCQDVGF